MDRRSFLKRSARLGAGLAATAAAGCGSGETSHGETGKGAPAIHTAQRVRWRLVSSFPRSLDTIFGGAEHLAARLDALSAGRFTLRVYPAGELVPAFQVMDAVEQGTVQVGHTASYYYTGKNPALAFDACVPFGFTSRLQTAWLEEGGGLELLRGLFADFGIINLPAGNTGAQMGGWFNRAVDRAADLRGLRMRIPGLGGEVMSRLGATVQQIPGGEIFQALERGTIDATEWVGPYDDEKLGIHKVARYYYYPGWWEPGPSLTYMVSRPAWNALSADQRAMFTAAARSSALIMQARYDQRNPAALDRLAASDIEIRPFSTDLMRAAADVTRDMLEEQARADVAYRKVYDAWTEARKAGFRWFRTAELAYANFAFNPS